MPDIFIASNEKIKTSAKPSGHAHMFASFCPNPIGVSFIDQEKDEEILLFLRRHFITNVPWLLISLILALLPIVIVAVISKFSIFILPNFSPTLLILAFMLYYLVVLTFIFVNFITWYYNISLVTNKRIVDIDFSGLLYKNVAATTLALVQDVSYTQIGVIPAFFDYGDVNVQTAGTLENFDFTAVPHPQRVVQIIANLIGKEKNVP